MKNVIKKALLALVVAGSIAAVSEPASAYWRHGYWGGGWGPGYGYRTGWGYGGYGYHGGWRHGYGYKQCRWIPAHWRHGYWVPAQRRCWW